MSLLGKDAYLKAFGRLQEAFELYLEWQEVAAANEPGGSQADGQSFSDWADDEAPDLERYSRAFQGRKAERPVTGPVTASEDPRVALKPKSEP